MGMTNRWTSKGIAKGHGRSISLSPQSHHQPDRRGNAARKIKCLMVGSPGVGKTSLIATFARGQFPDADTTVPVLFEPTVAINFKDASKSLPRQSIFSYPNHNSISDPHLSGEFGQLFSRDKVVHVMVQDITTVDTVARSLKGLDPSYASADVVMIVYSIDDPESFEDAWYKWFKEVSDFCPNAPVILVACKSDLREEVQSSSGSLISNHDGTMMSQRMFAHSFIETSAKAQHNVDLAFASAARAVLTVANQEAKRVSQKTVRKRIDELKNDMEDLWEKVQDLIHPPSKEPIQPTSLIS